MRELVYYVAVSIDGCIAAPDGSFEAFATEGDHMERILTDFADALPAPAAAALGVVQDRRRFDAVLMGANTHAVGLPALPSPYPHLEQVVFTHRDLPPAPSLRASDEDPVEVVRRMKEQEGAGIWLCGGGVLAARLRGEIDRLILKRYPVLLGAGIPLFAPGPAEALPLDLVGIERFASGVVIEEYARTGAAPSP